MRSAWACLRLLDICRTDFQKQIQNKKGEFNRINSNTIGHFAAGWIRTILRKWWYYNFKFREIIEEMNTNIYLFIIQFKESQKAKNYTCHFLRISTISEFNFFLPLKVIWTRVIFLWILSPLSHFPPHSHFSSLFTFPLSSLSLSGPLTHSPLLCVLKP